MKVAYIMSRFPHLPETFILREMVALEREGVQVELFPIVTQREKVVHPDAEPWLKRVQRFSLFSPQLWIANSRLFFSNSRKYIRLLKQLIDGNRGSKKFLLRALVVFPKAVQMAEKMKARGVDHIHAHYATHPALAAFIINNLTGIPYSVSVHAHDIFVDQTMMCEKLKSASFIRSISEYNKSFLIKHCGPGLRSKIEVIHCGINLKNYQENEDSRKGKFRILSIGSLQPYKGQEYLIKACLLLKRSNIKFSCDIIGGGGLRSSLEQMIHNLGVEDVIRLIGMKTENEVAGYLRKAHCYVQPSVMTDSGKMEGIPVAIMEAMASKLAVIASNISGIPELIEDQISGFLIPPADEVALAERIFWIYKNPLKAKKMGEQGFIKVKQNFDLQKTSRQLIGLFTQYTGKRIGDK